MYTQMLRPNTILKAMPTPLLNQVEVNVYFGMSINPARGSEYGTIISYSEMQLFCELEINPVFASYSLYTMQGVWEGTSEDSVVATFITAATNIQKVIDIAATYKQRYSQDSVLVTVKSLTSALLV